MKLYLECNMGAAGDMLMAALLELLPDRDSFLQKMNGLGIPGVRIECVPSEKCGITGSHIHVLINDESETAHDISLASDAVEPHAPSHQHEHPHDHCHEHSGHEHSGHEHTADGGQAHSHHHFSCADIRGIISSLDLPEKVKADALAVYRIIGEAESDVHGVPVEQIHFHEVGSMDAVVDVVGCCLLIYLLGVTEITASPVHVGSGFVRCAHGILPVPAPATANILKGIPVYGGTIKGELCTPTGAALLRHYVSRFGEMGPMSVTDIGYGMGSKNFEAANCVRAFLGDTGDQHDEIIDISCNLDDMT
ncbi:MAG: nickel insertion protein, partial [Oscillospiraceae bacterium]